MPPRVFRASIFHTPRDPFIATDALDAHADGGVVVEGGRVLNVGPFSELTRMHPQAEVVDRRGALLLPGFVDAHVHYPQLPVVGAMGMRLLEWLQQRTLPEEARLADRVYARERARAFLRALAGSGTTSALVFGAHYATAMEEFFAEAAGSGLRIAGGLVVSDRELRDELHTTPDRAYLEGRSLIERWHGRGRLRYAVTPRFSLSCSDELLEACGALAREHEEVLTTTHLNETRAEIAVVAGQFPATSDYLATYEQHGLVGSRSVFAHDVHPTDSELARLAAASAVVCHCPTSNMFLGSGLFPMRRHLERGVRLALGTDVGAGTGFGLLKEALAAYQVQMLREDGVGLTASHLLYLATAGGALALDLPDVGSFGPGMAFDAVVLVPREGAALEEVLAHSPSAEASLAALFTLSHEVVVREVYVGGQVVA